MIALWETCLSGFSSQNPFGFPRLESSLPEPLGPETPAVNPPKVPLQQPGL